MINNINFIMSVFSSTNILFIHRTTLFYWKFWCSAGLSLYKESSPNGMTPICVSYGSSPTCRRRTVFPVFQPLISGLLSVVPEVSACCITASKAGWATAGWRMLNTYVPLYSLSCVSFTLSADHHCDHKCCLGHAVKVHRGI